MRVVSTAFRDPQPTVRAAALRTADDVGPSTPPVRNAAAASRRGVPFGVRRLTLVRNKACATAPRARSWMDAKTTREHAGCKRCCVDGMAREDHTDGNCCTHPAEGAIDTRQPDFKTRRLARANDQMAQRRTDAETP